MYTPRAKRRLFTPTPGSKRLKASRARTVQRVNRRVARGPRTSGTLYQQVKSLQRTVKNLAPEIKYIDVPLTSTNVTTAGTAIHLTPIAQGDTDSTRTGASILLKNLTLRWRVDIGSMGAANFASRFAIIQNLQQVPDTAPAVSAVFTGSNPVSALPNVGFLENYKILYMSPYLSHLRMQTFGTQSNYIEWSWNGNIKVDYNGTASTDIQKNGIYFVFVTNDTSDTQDFDGIVRIGYTDV